jgi:GTPase involved in cell partitioning and DNA repair
MFNFFFSLSPPLLDNMVRYIPFLGLVGKPSAGKSTFFNAATAFSRQRGQQEGDTSNSNEYGGASMAAHPFTTIDPNIGYVIVV